MEFPGRWDVFAMEEFSTAIARSPGECGHEILAQAKENGRLIDHFKMTLNVSFSTADIFTVSKHPRLEVPVDPACHRDILLRRNIGSSTLSDLYTGILSNEITVFDKNGPVPKEKVEDFFKQGKDKLVLHAAGRWAASIDEDQRSMMGLHSLPASTSHTAGWKPCLQREACPNTQTHSD